MFEPLKFEDKMNNGRVVSTKTVSIHSKTGNIEEESDPTDSKSDLALCCFLGSGVLIFRQNAMDRISC